MALLEKKLSGYYLTKTKYFEGIKIDRKLISIAFEFATEMVFGIGHHRNHRTGGQVRRKNGELFANTFQGKVAELILYDELKKNGLNELQKPDLGIYQKGVWDDSDLVYKGKQINIKSAAFFSNLLLLEAKDWNNKGEYIPNINSDSPHSYDYFVLIRIKPDIKLLLKNRHLFYSDHIKRHVLNDIILNEDWAYDIAGCCSIKTIEFIIKNNYFLPQNSMLNGKTRMDADNYYIQSGKLFCINKMINELKKF